MSTKRMRIFAGPNGSGKTTLVKRLQSEIPFGVYINADDIEYSLKQSKILIFNSYQIIVTEAKLQDFFKKSQFSPIKREESDLWTKLVVKDNVVHINTKVDSYLSADLAEFIRQELLENGISFSYETVMSNINKVDFLNKAKQMDYKVYLYFVCTEDPEINKSRVKLRVSQNGHTVSESKIEERYYKSLSNLKNAVINSDRAYLWDNSNYNSQFIAEVTSGSDIKIADVNNVPNWFYKYLID